MSDQTTGRLDAATVSGRRWQLEPSGSRVEFSVPHFYGLMKVHGRFDRFDGSLDLNADPAIELNIDATSVNTGNRKRDEHLRSDDFFGVEKNPQVRFVSEKAVLDGESLAVTGRLYAAGSSVPLTLEATIRPIGDELELKVATDVDQRELGITWSPMGLMRRPTRLKVEARLVAEA